MFASGIFLCQLIMLIFYNVKYFLYSLFNLSPIDIYDFLFFFVELIYMVRVAFYREIVTFWSAEVGGGSKCWNNRGFDEVKTKKCN